MNFEFATATRIIFGAGKSRQLAEYASTLGRRALVVTGGTAWRSEPLLASLSSGGMAYTVFPVTGEPTIAIVEQGAELGKKDGCDFVISIGGGSVMDTGKAIAAMLTNGGKLLDYMEVIARGTALGQRPAPFIAVPTTAGTGSEVTSNAVLLSPEHRVKVSLRHPQMLATVAVVDPELTYDLPPALTASTGLDALTQLIEPYVCLRANPLTDGLCLDGINRVVRSLREAVVNGRNPAARADMAMASLFGGLALANAGLGAVHGFAGPIGGMFPVPHGAICAALLPHVMEANLKALRAKNPTSPVLRRYDRVAWILTGSQKSGADDGVAWVNSLIAELGVQRLGEFGIGEEYLPEIAAKAASASSMKANPVALTPSELTATLRLAL